MSWYVQQCLQKVSSQLLQEMHHFYLLTFALFECINSQGLQILSSVISHSRFYIIYCIIAKSKRMTTSQSKISKISLQLYRPFTSDSPLHVRQNNFLLDCVSRQNSTLPTYRIEEDAFVKPYLSTIISKVKISNLVSPTVKDKNSFKVRKVNPAMMDGEKFKAFLAQKLRQVSKMMEQAKTSEFSSCRNTPEKENLKLSRQQTQEEMFISAKFSCYKPRSRPKLPKRVKNTDPFSQK